MKRMIYQVAVGAQSNLYKHCIKSTAEYCKKYGIEHIVQTEPVLKIRPDLERTGRSKEAVERLGYLPIFEKETAFLHINEYDQIAIIDSDIYIRPTAPNIFKDFPKDFGKVYSDWATFKASQGATDEEVFELLEKSFKANPTAMSGKNIFKYFDING